MELGLLLHRRWILLGEMVYRPRNYKKIVEEFNHNEIKIKKLAPLYDLFTWNIYGIRSRLPRYNKCLAKNG